MKRLRLVICLIGAFALAAFMTACAATNTDDAAEAEDAAEDDATQETEPVFIPAPELDVETMTADLDGETIPVERAWGETYVGAVDENLFVAVSFPDEAEAGGPREAMVYLCDSVEIAEYLTGEVGDGTTTLEGEALDVELAFDGDTVSGAVTLDGEEPRSFTADEATGDAGLYKAEGDFVRRHWPDEANGRTEPDAAQSASDARIAGAITIPPRSRDYVGGWIVL